MTDFDVKTAISHMQERDAMNNTQVESEIIKNAIEKDANPKTNKKSVKKYYFLKLCSGFMNEPEMNYLYNSAANSENPVVEGQLRKFCYYLLLEFSIRGQGRIYNGKYPYTPKFLATLLNVPENTLFETIKCCQEQHLITITDKAEIIMNQFDELVASTSAEAIRKMKERKAKEMSEAEQKEMDELIRIAKTKWLQDDSDK